MFDKEVSIMDTSERYIRMCEKSPKVQPHDLEFLNGDCIFYKGKWGMYFEEKFYDEHVYNDGSLIDYDLNPFRLHTQNQLQEIANQENNLTALLQDFISWLSKECNLPMHLTSMEQLWLAFVMKKKYSKVWIDEEWVNADTHGKD